MKRVSLSIVLFVILILCLGSVSFAHSGRTDSNGGHNCSEKSISKGLCTGYHYHNGGSTPMPSKPAQNKDKDCSDFENYDAVVEYWNAKGYTKDYDPENLDGWGNGVVDDGVPCEPPSGYDTSKINGSPAQIALEERKKGEESGYNAGYQAGIEGEDKSIAVTGSEDFSAGFEKGYNKGYEDGLGILEEEMEVANKTGYEYGSKNNELIIPDKFTSKAKVKQAFINGFNNALKVIEEKEMKSYENKGYKDGLNDELKIPNDVKDVFVNAYNKGYERGQEKLKSQYFEYGYNDAFKILEYKDPSFENEKFITWYKEGFESNEEALSIQESAFQSGLSGEEYRIPDGMVKAEVIYKHYYDKGFEKYEKEKRQDSAQTASVIGVGILGWIGRRFYVAKKMIR